jgi:tricorn protease
VTAFSAVDSQPEEDSTMRSNLARAIVYLSLLLGALPAVAATKLLRFPDIHGAKVAFSYAGDVWTAPAAGGTATRLTAHPGQELFPRFSPDGQWIAFTGQYDGDEQVYVVPAGGGVPRQLTWYPANGPLPPRWGYDNQVYDWTPDGQGILFRSFRYGSLLRTHLYTVSVAGGLPVQLPMRRSGGGDLSPDGRKVVYSPLSRDFRTWKRYQGGWSQDLHIFDLDTHELTRVTDHPRSDRDPMWIGDAIYFSSDRDGKLNLYRYDIASAETTQLTHEDTWDVRWPGDDGEGRIVYELNGELRIFDVAAGASAAISIDVPDDGLAMRPARVSAAGNIEDFELSPKGERALFVARGDVFTAPIDKGPTRNLTRSSGAHDKWARWSPDGRKIAFISDRDGEEEVYLVDQDGSGEPDQLTDGGSAMRYAPVWSPDGKRLAFADKDGKLWVLEVASRRLKEIADDPLGEIRDYVWSPRGGHLAFTLANANGFGSITVWSVAGGELHRVTDEIFNDFHPAWDPAGDFLYYLSDREYAPQISSVEWNFATDRETYVYALALRTDVEQPFPQESDEVTLGEEDEEATTPENNDQKKARKGDKKDAAGDEEEATSKEPIAIDWPGLAGRIVRIPMEADNYDGLSAVEGYLVVGRGTPLYYGRSADVDNELHVFSFEEREAKTLAADIQGYALSADGKKALIRHAGGFKIYDVGMDGVESAEDISTAGLEVDRVPAAEWAEIFDEVWRRFRDFFYVENMHGYDWQALREQYRPWLAHVAHRSDLNYVIGEMIAELSVGHAYIQGGDFAIPERPRVALLGAELELDAAAGRYRISRVLAGHNGEDRYRSPLTEVGVDVAEGDYLLAIDGEELAASDNPYRLLRYKADEAVELTINSEPVLEGARRVEIQPVDDESSLRYLSWVLANKQRVDAATEGRVGYLHLPDMGADGISEFIKWYYPQLRKEGLVVDVRSNGGGNVSQMLIERLSRELLGTRFVRTQDLATTYPNEVFYGHMVCLLNEDSGSDGDIFPYRFREAGLGPLIGKRSWGGVVGITGHGPLIDGGSVFVPEFGTNDIDGNWIIEGYGVEPDIEVEFDARDYLEGRDPQLERGIQEVLRRIAEDPRRLPSRPADPVKTE